MRGLKMFKMLAMFLFGFSIASMDSNNLYKTLLPMSIGFVFMVIDFLLYYYIKGAKKCQT